MLSLKGLYGFNKLTFSVPLLVLVTLFLKPASIYGECDKCIDRTIALYDVAINVPRPTGDTAILKWFQLFWPARYARGYSFNNDPSKDCFTWLDGGIINANESNSGTLKFGIETTNLPHAGANSIPYLFTGLVSSTGIADQYTFTWRIECGTTREIVKSASATFSTVDISGIQTAAETAASALMPLKTIIEDFENKKRESDMHIARNSIGAQLNIRPERTNLKAGDSTNVEIEMIDCDGYPLKNRTIFLKDYTDPDLGLLSGTTGGTIKPTEVTTDNDGKAHIMFTADQNSSIAIVRASYPFTKPHGFRDAILGSAAINLQKNQYLVNVQYTMSYNSQSKYDSIADSMKISQRSFGYDEVKYRMSFVYEDLTNSGSNDSVVVITIPDDSITGIANQMVQSGNRSYNSMSRDDRWDLANGDHYVVYNSINSNGVTGDQTDPGLYLNPNGIIPLAQIEASFHITGNGINYINNTEPSTTKIDDWSPVVNDQYQNTELTWTKLNDGSYTATGMKTNNLQEAHSSSKFSSQMTVHISGTQPNLSAFKNTRQNANRINLLVNGNSSTSMRILRYTLPNQMRVNLSIYNLSGEKIVSLLDKVENKGDHQVVFDSSRFPSGIFVCKLEAGTVIRTAAIKLLQ